MRFLITALFVVNWQFSALAGDGKTEKSPNGQDYYGSDFYQSYQSGQLKNRELVESVQKIISKNQTVLGYDRARKELFGRIYLQKVGGSWAVTDVYCENTFTNQQQHIGPGLIPDANVVNTEHTWPQSRFTGRFPKEMQKSDLHHLFPTDTQMNSSRSSLRFGEVRKATEKLKCQTAELGHNDQGDIVFEPPRRHKGNVARAIFYFSVRYQMKISNAEEADLRKWNHEDPVDEEEMLHNDQIQAVQGNRNPFIDFPEMADKIQNFSDFQY